MRHLSTPCVFLLVLAAAVGPALGAQATTGSISGVVRDMSGAVVPGVAVSVASEDTGLARTVVTGRAGSYRVLDLPPGSYRVAAALAGFDSVARGGIVVQIGSHVTVDLSMEVAGVVQRVEVTAAPARLDTRGTALGGVVTREQIAELPLNGRSYLQLATLQPGVVVSRATGREFTGGFGATPVTVAGARPEHMGYLLDGTNIGDISDKAPSSVAGVLLGVDAVQEFSVQTHGFGAEFGRAAGGVVSAVTKSGTNRFRGSVFEFHRDSALDARGYFDTGELPHFERDQFGGSLGGPVRQNSLFFFGAYEGLRERRAVTRVARLPDQAAHDGRLPDASGVLQPVAIHPTVRPYLDLLFPVATGASFGDGTAELRHAHLDPVDEHFAAGRLDWRPTGNDAVMVRVSGDRSDTIVSQAHPLFVNTTGTRTLYSTAQYQRVFGPRGLNSLRVAVNTTGRDDDMVPTVDIPPALYFTEDPHFGVITVVGVTAPGSVGSVPILYDQTVLQLSDTFTWTGGTHLWKFGGDYQRYDFGGYSYSRYGGEFRFRNLAEFLTLRRSATAQADRFTGNLPGTDTRRSVRQHYLALFAEDDWRVLPNLTVNLGLRYDFATVPVERDGLMAGLVSLDDLESGPRGVTPGAPLFQNPSTWNFAPRLGAAWDLRGNGRTVVRGGYGLFYQPLTVSYFRGTVFRVYPYFAGVDIRQPAVFGPGIQEVLANASGADVQRRSEFIDYNARQPVVEQWHASVERSLGGRLRVEAAYFGSRGHNLPFYGDPNSAPTETLPDGRIRVVAGSTVRYPSWGRIRTRTNVARSIAHALTLGVRSGRVHGLAFQAAYTLANARDTWSGGQMGTADFDNGAGSATNWWDPEAEFGPSSFDIRHTLALNALYELPFGRTLTGTGAALAQGWHVGGVLQLASGLPFTPFIGFDRAGDGQSDAELVQKPDRIGPVAYPRTADAWFDVSAFALPPAGTYGNARRNSLRGPGLALVDLVVFKDIRIGPTTLQVRVEAFNALNRVNLGLPDASVLFNTDGTYRSGAGRITTTATSARQIQLGVKLVF